MVTKDRLTQCRGGSRPHCQRHDVRGTRRYAFQISAVLTILEMEADHAQASH
jgi:hypothetical protein